MPVGRCGYWQPHQITRGDLQRVPQRHDLGELVQRTFPVLDPVELRLTHPGQLRDHHQRLIPSFADSPQPLPDRARAIKIHEVPLHRRDDPSPMPRDRRPGAVYLSEGVPRRKGTRIRLRRVLFARGADRRDQLGIGPLDRLPAAGQVLQH